MSPTATDPSYVLGRSRLEQQRLEEQARFLRPSTERLLRAAGIGPPMRVLDVGCGIGDVSFLAAELVGASGAVVGIDLDADALAVAEQRRVTMNIANASFVCGDFRTAPLVDTYDAAVGRFVLMYQADPTEALRSIAGRLRPNGILAFQEIAAGLTPWDLPDLPLLNSVFRWKWEVFVRSGSHMNLGAELYWRMCDAGLVPHRMPLAEVPLDIGSESAVYDRHAALIRSILPKILEYGLATEAEIDIENLEQLLRDEALAARATVPGDYLVIGQWARTPAPR